MYENSQVKEEKTKSKPKTNWKAPKEGNALSYNEQKEFKRLEREIEKLEEEKSSLEARFTDVSLAAETITELSIELGELSKTIEEKTERWFDLSSKMD